MVVGISSDAVVVDIVVDFDCGSNVGNVADEAVLASELSANIIRVVVSISVGFVTDSVSKET